MRTFVDRIGVTATIALVTFGSMTASVAITYLILETFGTGIEPLLIAIALIAPALIAPPVIWVFVRLIQKVSLLEEQQRRLACTDELTKVLSRRAFMYQLGEAMTERTESPRPMCLAIMDIDNFKSINDTYGHGGGDAVLRSMSQLIKRSLRAEDVIGRIGGEEFAILLLDAEIQSGMSMLERIRGKIETHTIRYQKHSIEFTASIGVTCFEPAAAKDEPEVLMRRADQALYAAKKCGKNQVVCHAA